MLHLNMLINGYQISAIVAMFRAGQQDGAIVLGQRANDKELVVAQVEQDQIDQEGPAAHWVEGHYFPWGPEDTDLNSQAAIKASAFFGERTGIAAMISTVEGWAAADQARVAAEAAKTAAQAALDKVLDKAKDRTYTLIFTDYSESLTPKQVDVLLRGDNPWESSEFSNIEEAESDQSYDNAVNVIKDILDEEEFEALDAESDLLDEARFFIQDRNDTDIVESLLKTTGSLLVRYDLGVDVDTDYTSSDEDRREQAVEILRALGVLNTDEVLIAAIVAILVESGSGRAYMFWYADVEDLVKAASPFQQARFTQEDPAPKATITFTDVELLVLNKFSGSGYSDKVPGTFTIEFDATNLVTDEGDNGYSWKDIAGLSSSAFKSDVTIAPVTPADDSEKNS